MAGELQHCLGLDTREDCFLITHSL